MPTQHLVWLPTTCSFAFPKMTTNRRIWHETYQCWWKRSRVESAFKNCAAIWIEDGASIRNMTVAESIAARNDQARIREPLPFAEVHGLRFDPPASGVAATRRESSLNWAAIDFMRPFTRPKAA